MLRKSCDNKTIRITSSTLMNKHLLILWMLATGLLEKHSLQASEITEEADKATSVHKDSSSFMTHQDLENRLSLGLFPYSKQRIQIALAPATQEYLTEEFMTIVQKLSRKMDIFEKCYVIRAVMKIPVSQLTMLSDILTVEQLEQVQALPNSERVSFIKKLYKIEPTQWQNEIVTVIKKYPK